MPARAVPLSPKVLRALSPAAFHRGWRRMGASLVLAFHALLRLGELLDATAQGFTIAPDGLSGILSLPFTEGGQRRGTVESVTLSGPFVLLLVQEELRQLQGPDLFCPLSGGQFRKRFACLLSDLSLISLGYRPYSLRRGGATEYFRTTGNLDLTADRGRWASLRTARIYLNEGQLMLTEIQFSQQQMAAIDRWNNVWCPVK